ncbi:butyrophilin subfamily 1 member A1-like isoform X4 [Apteryx mantelli]|uniref:Butyrophilin subfamily 1 member A1-like isoform X4 n=1 Tax=Apteryx mantelli TaxID=2696672 RepID=A0ABM4FXV4_9AVES
MRFLLGSGCSSLANHPWGVLCYLVTLHVLHLGSAQLKVVGPGHAVTATVGQSIVLPCQISPSLNAQSMAVRWIRHHIAETVHQYEDGEDLYVEQMREYQGRTVLSHDGLSRGSLDLQIVSVRPSDDGTYICTVEGAAGYAEATVELEVAAIGSSPLVSLEGYQGGGIQVVCRSSGWFPEPEVLWKDLQGQRLPSVSQRHSHDERGLFEIEHSLSVTGEADGDLSCVVRNSRLGQEKESSLHISAPFFHDAQPWKVALAVMLVALLVLIPGLILFSVRLFKKREQQSSDLEEKSRGLGKVFIFLEEESRGLEKLSRGLGEQSRDLEKLSRGLEEQSRDLGKVLILQKEQSRDLGKQSSVLEEQSSVLGKLFSFLGKLYSVLGEQSRDLEEQSSVLETVFSFLGKQSRDLGEQSRDLVELSSVMEQLSRGLEEQSRDLGKVFIFLEERSRDLEKLSRGLEEQSRDLEEQSIFLEEGSRDLGKQSRDLEKLFRGLKKRSRDLEQQSRGLEQLSRGLDKQSRDLEKISRGLVELSSVMGERLRFLVELSRDLGKPSGGREEQSTDLEKISRGLEKLSGGWVQQSRDLEQLSRGLVELSSVLDKQSRGLEILFRGLEILLRFLVERSRGLEEQSRGLETKTMELREQAAELAWRRLVLPVDKEEVSLDPDTAHPQLILSEDCRGVRWGDTRQNLPNSQKRFDSSFCVLGRKGFIVGKHWWEVEGEVGAESHWAVGVARESLRRKGPIEPSPDKGIWAVQYQKGKFEALTSPPTTLSFSPVPKRIWVCLDCTGGQVTFVSADNGAEIYTFRSFPLVWGRIRPWFCVEKGAVWLGPSNSTPPSHAPHPTSSAASEASCPSPDAPSAPLLAPAAADGQLSSAQTQGAGSG